MNKNDFAIACHWCDDDRRFAMHNRPRPRVWTGGCLHTIPHNFEIPIGEVLLA